ncbi:PSD1 and planctomycete cytochrome C domain-containing protein [uncultured Gimesia sp.]|uniref:PSD1 and planctomycete cytochrome C domain-containing protein n=1 Tax=uncultured Gimesia sp. TaxID=1678688 RepID=UPI002614126C|nr:PSD1 and planctomycete cytochrome C domain-containing protein [uncultured Gimesia sp.]
MTSKQLIQYCLTLFLATFLSAVTALAEEQVDYLKEIKPLLKTKCLSCHGPLKQQSGFRVDTAKFLQKGGENEIGFEPGKANESFLLGVLTGDAGFRMPPEGGGKHLTADELKLIRDWINSGAHAPENEQPENDPRQFWSYQLQQKPAVPKVKNAKWVRNEIDAFLSAEHEKRGLVPRPSADPAILLRRLYLDLIGLPPTRKELNIFLADPSEAAYEATVDKLLASPQYGERWGRHWMDVWRYSDWYGSRGNNEIRYSQRHIWRWRDWIVESVNSDKPYDRMILEMLAGDELEPGNSDVVRATGFLGRNWYKFDRNVWMYETVEQTSVAFLGLTMKCCRCHEHKYDPLEQLDYYRFRAFFEPHNVRTDAISASAKKVKDGTEFSALKDGLARVFDKEPSVPTYLFIRGDDRQPDKENPVKPGVPAVLGNAKLEIKPVTLPVESYYPALKPGLLKDSMKTVKKKIDLAESELKDAQAVVTSIKEKLTNINNTKVSQTTETDKDSELLVDLFKKPNPQLWNSHSGKWEYKNGRLAQTQVGSFVTMSTKTSLPLDFQGRLRYKTLKPGGVHSVGLFFDMDQMIDAQAIYTAIANNKATVQAFHRQGGKETYPRAGVFPCDIKLDEEVILDFVVKGQLLNVWLNGELKIVYTMPIARKVGNFALWNHSATSEFHELRIEKIQSGFQLATNLEQKKRSPFLPPTKENLEQELSVAIASVALAQQKIRSRTAESTSLNSRIAAEQAKITDDKSFVKLAKKASQQEREFAVQQAVLAIRQIKRDIAALKVPETGTKEKANPKLVTAEKMLTAAQNKHKTATAAIKQENTKYSPLGTTYPKTSTGRRLALARWIANEKNPRTARVAVNHIWLRHFNQAIVPTVANFGLNGQLPTHPQLLDWLAISFIENGWQMKPMHKLMVLSNAYRMSSTDGEGESNSATDPDNHFLWRMNSRRMEAEVVRDSLLATAGTLDLKMGGPELEEKQGENILRRSLYFRITPNEKMEFLELFDLANPNSCYERSVSVVPQQSLALTNSSLALDQARLLASQLTEETGSGTDKKTEQAFIQAAFAQVLSRPAKQTELTACLKFLTHHTTLLQKKGHQRFPGGGTSKRPPSSDHHQRARENLVHVLYSHNDFVTIR